MEGHAELLELGPKPRDVVAVDEPVGVRVQQVRARPGQHERRRPVARHHPEPDPHGLGRAMGRARIGGDDDDHRLGGVHDLS